MKLLASALALGVLAAPARDPVVQVGDFAPGFEGDWYLSKASSLEDVRGRVVLIDFWRTW